MSIFEWDEQVDSRTEPMKSVWINAGMTESQHVDFDPPTSTFGHLTILAALCRHRGGSRTALPCRDLE
jgi:hypothetical protein